MKGGPSPMMGRVEVEGRHLRLNGERFVVRGTAYGPFAPRTDGARYPEPPRLRADLASIAASGLNTIRTFDVPPADLLAAAADTGLRVLVGLDYPDWRFEPFPDRSSGDRITAAGLAAVDRLFDRVDDPEVLLAVSVGRTLPTDLVRVHHPDAVAETLSSIVGRIHELEPSVLATYTGRHGGDALMTVDGCDLLSIVLDSECEKSFDRDLHRLQQARPARPVVVTDLEPPSVGSTAAAQARDLAVRLNALDRAGCAGATVATWVTEYSTTDADPTSHPASLVRTDGAHKLLGRCVETWARQNVKDLRRTWPRVTALVRAHNSESTIERCLSALELSDYHDLEVIVCDEGSTDRTLALASRFPFEMLQPERSDGTSRTNGLEAASGDILAFLDADVVCHPLWPWYLALAFDSTDRVAVVNDHLVEVDVDADASSVALAAAALADVGRLPAAHPLAAVVTGGAGLAVRRSALGTARLASGSAAAAGEHLIRDLGSCLGDGVGSAPAAQAVRRAPDNFGAVWRNAVRRGRIDRQAFESSSTANERRRQVVAELLTSTLTGERPPRPVALRALLDYVVPLLTVAAVLGAAVAVAGATGAGLVITATAILTAAVLAAVVAHDVVDRSAHNATTKAHGRKTAAGGLAVAVIVVLEPLAHTWGRLRARPRPSSPTNRSWTGDREDWLTELRWRLGLAHLSVFTPANRSRWDIEVRCGLFLRRLIVAAVAWQWTPHVRTALRPRWQLLIPVAAAAAATRWSPLTAALIASATAGVLAFELVTLRRVDRVIRSSIAGSLPPVGATIGPDVELAARSTLDL